MFKRYTSIQKHRNSIPSTQHRTHQEWNKVSQDCCLILSTSFFIALTLASISVTLAASCCHSWSWFRILHPGGRWSAVTGDRYISSDGIKSGIPIWAFPRLWLVLLHWRMCVFIAVLSSSLHSKDGCLGQHCINQDSCSRTMTHCIARCCSLSVHCWMLSWGGNATLYSLAASTLESSSCIQLRRFLFRKTKGEKEMK